MAQKFDYPETESIFHTLQDQFYKISCDTCQNGKRPAFKGLMEIISSEAVIVTAIHKIKANKGSMTPGSDGKNIRDAFLERPYEEVIKDVQEMMVNYNPDLIRRKWIPKPGKKEMRPLGIPTIADRVIQECIRLVLEPIFEAQMFKHSYGFRPMREASMAIERLNYIVFQTGYHWVIEGDISKFFDKVDHTILLKRLWHMGIRDKRLLMIIKEMLKAGIMGECKRNQLGTPQGGILSPLLANIYLDAFDQWVTKQWENKKTENHYNYTHSLYDSLRRRTRLQPAYLIRYADDWVLVTNTKTNALEWKKRIADFLKQKLKLELSEEKTLITNIRKNYVKFLGFELKYIKGNSRKGYVSKSRPNQERLKNKVKEIHKEIRQLRRVPDKGRTIDKINVINSKIRGVINYYETATFVNIELSKYARILRYAAINSLKEHGVRWTPAKETNNLLSVHSKYEVKIPAVIHEDFNIGITSLSFCIWKRGSPKNPKETPYTQEGREIHVKRTGKKPLLERADEFLSENLTHIVTTQRDLKLYNFEYVMNRPYAFNRDKGKCKVCGNSLSKHNTEFHHINTNLSLGFINKVSNLASVHRYCHDRIHDGRDYSHLDTKTWKKITGFREKLNKDTTK